MNTKNIRTYNGNPMIKAHGVVMEYTREQVEEYIRCSEDPVYFIERYCKILTNTGFTSPTLRDYQKRFIDHVDSNLYSVVCWPRQSGKSTTSALYVLWEVLFHADKNWFILANKADTAREIFSRLKDAYEGLPFWLQQGVKKLNESTIELSNNSTVKAAATSKSSIRGSTATGGVILDEFSFVEHDEEFYTSTFPVISSCPTAKIIMTSTPNGMNNLFYKTVHDARKGRGNYALMEIAWNEIPGRDEEWRAKTIETIGQRRFDQEFNASFLGAEGTLIPLNVIERIDIRSPEYTTNNLNVYERPQPTHKYFITVDVSRGSGLDYSAFSVIDITEKPFKQVATYYNADISTLLYPHVIYEVATKYNNAYVLVELNDAGIQVADILQYDLEYEEILWVGTSGRSGQTLGVGQSQKPGVRTTKPVKTIGCSNLKTMLEEGNLEIWDQHTFLEMTSFILKGNQYEADTGSHDDLMMTLVLFAWASTQSYFGDLVSQSNRKELIAAKLKNLEAEMLPFGFFSGAEEPSTVPTTIDYTQNPTYRDEMTEWMLR